MGLQGLPKRFHGPPELPCFLSCFKFHKLSQLATKTTLRPSHKNGSLSVRQSSMYRRVQYLKLALADLGAAVGSIHSIAEKAHSRKLARAIGNDKAPGLFTEGSYR